MNKKGALILEFVWLALAVFAALFGIYKYTKVGFGNSYVFYIISAIASFMYILRRALRKFQENNKEKK
jgi:hypothetical protein